MNKSRNRQKEASAAMPFEQARDEMFQHVMRCGVIQAAPEHRKEWFNDTMDYLADRYHELTDREITELRTLGERFCQPPRAKQEASIEAEASAA